MEKIIDYYLRFERNQKTYSRFDMKAKSGSYSPIEETANKHGEIFVYYVKTDGIRHLKKKTDFALTIGNGKYLSGLFFPEIDKPYLAYGDIPQTNDLLLINIKDNTIEMFICKDRLQFKDVILQMYILGTLDEIIQGYREN
jgi:hypothetical protein